MSSNKKNPVITFLLLGVGVGIGSNLVRRLFSSDKPRADTGQPIHPSSSQNLQNQNSDDKMFNQLSQSLSSSPSTGSGRMNETSNKKI